MCPNCIQSEWVLAASTCFRCNKLTNEFKTCRSCRSSSHIFRLFKLGLYEDPIKQLVAQTKFGASRAGAIELGEWLAQNIPTDNYDLVTYIPTESKHVRERGFDHAKVMARQVATELDLPIVRSLARNRHIRQVGASRQQRQQQIKELFEAHSTSGLTDSHVLLIDDVVSTGATINAAVDTLKHAGAKRISVAVAAHNR